MPRYQSLLILTLLFSLACSDDAPVDESVADTTPDETDTNEPELASSDGSEEPDMPEMTNGSLRWDLAASSDDFFSYPFPSDLRVTERGTPDLSGFPTDYAILDLITPAIEVIENGPQGFSPLSTVYFSFEETIDPETLPTTVDESLEIDASAFILDITPESPTFGERLPVLVDYNEDEGLYRPAMTVTIHPLYEFPMRVSTTYAAVLTDSVTGPGETALEAPSEIAALAEYTTSQEAPPYFEDLVATLSDQDYPVDSILAATVFTTSDPMAELAAIRDWMGSELEPPTAEGVFRNTEREPNSGRYLVFEGVFDSEEFFGGQAPYLELGEGIISADATGEPTSRSDVELTFALSVPPGEMPEAGWPVVLYSHGLGEDYSGFIRVAAGPMATRGIAVLGINPPLQGDRNPTNLGDRDLILQLTISNIAAGREILRQGVFDTIRALRLVRSEFRIDSEITGGDEIRLDGERVAFMGHSEGAQIGALLLAVEPTIHPAVLSEGGGGAAITLFELDLPDFDVAQAVELALGISGGIEEFDRYHPAVSVVIQPLTDPADPLHGAPKVFLEPVDGSPHSVLMIEGFLDPLTPPPSIEALASAMGLPIGEPVEREIEGLILQGIDSVALPASGNLADGQATGALLQFPEDGHYMVYQNTAIRKRLFDFLESALAGDPVVEPAEE